MNRRHAALLLLAGMLGCSKKHETIDIPRYDSAEARAALIGALDAWKNGDARVLARRKPPIRFVDDDYSAGFRLTEYEIDEPDAPIELHRDVAVNLSLRDKKGKAVTREAHYQVGTSPGLAVLRSDR